MRRTTFDVANLFCAALTSDVGSQARAAEGRLVPTIVANLGRFSDFLSESMIKGKLRKHIRKRSLV